MCMVITWVCVFVCVCRYSGISEALWCPVCCGMCLFSASSSSSNVSLLMCSHGMRHLPAPSSPAHSHPSAQDYLVMATTATQSSPAHSYPSAQDYLVMAQTTATHLTVLPLCYSTSWTWAKIPPKTQVFFFFLFFFFFFSSSDHIY